jgi:hypothetical protein
LKGLPPIRALATTKKKKKVKKEKKPEDESKLKPKKLNSYDYRAWDKIDVVKQSFAYFFLFILTVLFESEGTHAFFETRLTFNLNIFTTD